MSSAKKRKIRVGILFGGRSAEHEVSLQSAKNVVEAIDKTKYEITLIEIDKNGGWHVTSGSNILPIQSQKEIQRAVISSEASPKAGEARNLSNTSKKISQSLTLLRNDSFINIVSSVDIIFPILHGPFGEDGTVQGLLKLANIPFVGASVLGSAIGMDKDVMKRLLREDCLPVAKFNVFSEKDKEHLKHHKSCSSEDCDTFHFSVLADQLGLPFFVKPANLGSSVGVSKVYNEKEFESAVENAFQYDKKILIEEYIKGREIECSILGNEHPIASIAGEIVPQHEFYDYDAKYIDESGALLKIPAEISKDILKKVQSLAVRAFQVLCCEGMARVDFFLRNDGELFINEINTIPGFTKISMYPKLWQESGITYTKLIDKLIELAIERFGKENKFRTSI